jgi:peptidoglycan/LPS O-acetylase OafA/YrhL
VPRLARVLQSVGDRSIALFLIHPPLLYLLSGPRITAFLAALPAPTLVLGLLLLGLTWAASEASRRLKLDGVLFGR